MNTFDSLLTASQRKTFTRLNSPIRIQEWLNSIPYSDDDFYRCPLRVLRDRKGHCFDGALFAAATLRRIGFPPLIVELIPNTRDDDHLLAVFKQRGSWGAVAQSNFSGLRYREPIYHSVRELVMSYFEDYFNSLGEKTLRGYRGPFNLASFDRLDWMASDTGLESLADGMDRYRITWLLTPAMESALAPVDERSLKAGLISSNPAGLFKVRE
jgi:hypothetical protein